MRAATYAKQIGRTVAFALAAFRQAFAGGRALAEPDNVVIAAAACEMHPRRGAQGGASCAACASGSRRRPPRAIALGVRDVPAVWDGERVVGA